MCLLNTLVPLKTLCVPVAPDTPDYKPSVLHGNSEVAKSIYLV